MQRQCRGFILSGMPIVSAWHCDITALTQDCYATGFGVATTSPATSTPLYVQDAGNVSYGLAWIVFFLAMIFLGMVWNALPYNRGI